MVLNLPGGYPGKTRFLGRPWAKLSRIGVSGASCSATLPEQGAKALGCDPVVVVQGPCGYPAG